MGGATSILDDMAYLPVILVIVYLSSSFADEFNCSSLPPLTKSAQNVYELKPQDIKVVMALGDLDLDSCIYTSLYTKCYRT